MTNEKVIKNYSVGLYSYSSKEDIFSGGCGLREVTDQGTIDKILKYNNVSYIEDNHDRFSCSEASGSYTQPYQGGKADWTDNGVISGSTGGGSGFDVYFYATDATKWGDGSTCTYNADQISFMYVNSKPSITIGAAVVFNADTVSFCGQKTDGAGGDSDELALKQGGTNSRFLLESASGGDVTVELYHKLVVCDKDGNEKYSLNPGTYEAASGTDLFSADAGDFTPKGGGGTGGSAGAARGFSGGGYSW
jgi:hypothetical protein